MIILGENFPFKIGVHNVNVDIMAAEDISVSGQNVFECLVLNTGQAPITVGIYYSATAIGTYTALKDRSGNNATITLAAGAQGTITAIAKKTTGYLKMKGLADLTKITIPAASGEGYSEPTGTITPRAEGQVRFLANGMHGVFDRGL